MLLPVLRPISDLRIKKIKSIKCGNRIRVKFGFKNFFLILQDGNKSMENKAVEIFFEVIFILYPV